MFPPLDAPHTGAAALHLLHSAEGDQADNWAVLIQEEIYEIMGEEVNLYLAGVNRWQLEFQSTVREDFKITEKAPTLLGLLLAESAY